MPSVRVKRNRYSSLTDHSRSARQSYPPLHTLFHEPEQPDTTQQVESPTTIQDDERQKIIRKGSLSASRMGRHRTGSRVYDSLRLQEPLLAQHTSTERVVTYEGSAADVQLIGEDGPSRIGSALNLPPVENENSPIVHVPEDDGHHHDDIVEHLEVIDPQVATVSHLTNAANSILIPPLAWYSRKPVVMLSEPPSSATDVEKGKLLEDSLDRHVDDVMKRRARIRRSLMGVWSFLKTPMGIITGIYGFLVVFWGAAIVLFLAKIINLHDDDKQGFWIEVSSQVTNGLFTITGIGLIPTRVLDTYRIYKIWYYKRRTKRLRSKAGLPQLYDPDDLPDPAYDPNYVHVLTEKEEKDLHRQQIKFQYSQTWYRPHGTETHRAFPINYALFICCLNDGNSIFQAMLCGCMWSMAIHFYPLLLYRFERPPWTTGTLIPASFLCGIFSAVFIARGSAISKRTKEVKEKLAAALSMERQSKHKGREPNGRQISSAVAEPPVSSLVVERDEEKGVTSNIERQDTMDVEPVVEEQMTVPSLLAEKATTT
ncbi:hypothetical protein L218DRAFT_994842 [Marasmius fiardii PR-910]|nr:hypothetical protein L218DRAFT_994842 [Marasmius fiardii PR-910]